MNRVEFVDLRKQYAALQAVIDAHIRGVLDHGQYIMGPEVGELERRLVEMTGAGHCITVASGTEALLISLMALGVGPGDEVITTPFTFAATAEAIVLTGATPVFVDIEPDTCNMAVAGIGAAITARTKAILPVSLYGQPPDIDEINRLAREHGLAVIEDGAQSFGATYHGKASGNLTTMGCTSFFPSKPLGCYGDGGAIFTSDDELAAAAREIRVHGQQGRYRHVRVGVGGRMDTLQCAIVLAKLGRFAWEIEQRQILGQRYQALLAEEVPCVACRDHRTTAYAQFTVRVRERSRVIETMAAAGIPTAVHYPTPLHRQPAYRDRVRAGACPHAEHACETVLSLPISADLTTADQDRVVAALLAAIR